MAPNSFYNASDPNYLPDPRDPGGQSQPTPLDTEYEWPEASQESIVQRQQDVAALKRILLGLLGLGLVLGIGVAIVVVWLMHQLDLINPTPPSAPSPPTPSTSSQVEYRATTTGQGQSLA